MAALLMASLAAPLAHASDDIVSKGVVIERERGDPLIAMPQTLPADLDSRSPTQLTIVVEPPRAGREADDPRSRTPRGDTGDRRR